MLKNQNIICISSIDWDFVWQGHQEIMSTFAKTGNRVLFIENTGVRVPSLRDIPRLKKRLVNWFKSIKGFRMETGNLYIYSPIILPFPYSKVARWLNKRLMVGALHRWMRAAEFHDPIIWTFLPTGTALDIINSLENKLIVYYCIADFYELVFNPDKIRKTEEELLRKSDLVFAQGEVLEARCKALNKNVHVFPFGVNMEAFTNFKYDAKNIPGDIKDVKRPIIGYIGGIHRHIDFKLINFIARSRPEWSIVLIGPPQTDTSGIRGLNNVSLLGQKDFRSLLNYMVMFDVGIIPYEINEYTRTVFPTKLNEYHAMGLPVISTDLPEVRTFNIKNGNLVLIAKTYKEFSDNILKALTSRNEEYANKCKASAMNSNWSSRIEEMSGLIENRIEEKANNPIDWQFKFLRLYRVARRKLAGIAGLLFFTYLLIFYTPVIWIIAEPLKIYQRPERADCIVVLAGGVGESGKAGQGYEERVEYGVELYKKGFADHVIFSSGYKYVFEEPLLMKALAVSLGVPEKAIILEDKAVNTYENVLFISGILRERNWKNILLISSPYHMRRLYFLVKKSMRGIKVFYTPITKSIFYSRVFEKEGKNTYRQITFPQIKAIMHEYASILYYKWRGFI